MAAETFSIEISINAKDNTDPGVSSAKSKMNGFDKQNEKTKKRLDAMNKTKWKVAIEAVDKVTGIISKIGTSVKNFVRKPWNFAVNAVDKVTAPVKKMISVMGDLLGVSTAVSTVLAGISVKNALEASAESSRMLTQLKVSAKNMGIDDSGIQAILDKASQIQATTMYSDDAMTGAAAELATYFEDTEAITRMMDTVIDYAAGMSGGVELSTEEIIDYTTNLAKMTTGAYDAMTKKGFEVTDAQKKILETGTDMEKVAVIESIIKENWEDMAEAMSNTPTGLLTRLKNSWGDISEMIGNKLTPGVTSLFKMLNNKMPTISKLIEKGADAAGTWLEEFMPALEDWIDSAIEWVDNFGKRVSEVFNSDDFKNADFFGKVKIAWNKIIAEPFSEWWDGTGRAWFAEKLGKVGEAIGSGLSTGLLALLGIDISETIADGTSVGGAFIEGFKKGFDTEKITEALKEWADNNKEIVIGIGAIVGFNLITGIAGKIGNLTSLFGDKGSKSGGGGDSTAAMTGRGRGSTASMRVTSTTTTVNGTVVNVYGASVNDMSKNWNANGSGGKQIIRQLLPAGSGGAGDAIKGLLGSGGSATGKASAAGGILGFLSNFAGATGATASGAGAMAAIGGGEIAGIIAGILTLISSGIDIYQGAKASKAGESKKAKDEYITAGTKVGIAGLGAGGGALAGAAIGAAGGPIGAGVGALIGLGIGGIGALLGGNKAGKAISDSTDEGGWLSNAWQATKKFFKEDLGKFFGETIPKGWNSFWGSIGNFFTTTIPQWWGGLKEKVSTFFTETIPEKWDEMWEGIGNFFTEDVPYAIGYACGKVEIFFTETIPGFFGDLWNGISSFFTDTLPTWASGIWNDHIVPFFTETVPDFFVGIWDAISTFFTDTLPTWASDVWNNNIVPFFTEDIPAFFTGLWDGIVTFFTDTLPTWASDVWNNNIVPFFTESIPNFFTGLWNGIVTFFTDTLPTWASDLWNNSIVPFFTEDIPGFFGDLWESVTKFVTEAIPQWASDIWGKISGWFGSIGDWLGDVWSKVKEFFGAGYSDAKGEGKHAWGGILNSPHMAMVAEDGAEAIIPLSPSKRQRGLDLWMNAGRLMGVQPYAEGGIVGEAESITMATGGGGGGTNIEVKVEVNPQFIIEARDAGFNGDNLVALIKTHIREMVDDIGDELAEKLARIFANMPVKGRA